MALGATHWQVVREVVFPGARSGIAAALTLAVGRALGESIAVAMVIGNNPSVPHSLVAPGATLGSAIVNEFAEAAPGIGTSSVIALAAVLLLLTLLVNAGGQAMLRGMGPGRLHREASPASGASPRGSGMSSDAGVIQLADAGADWSAREKRRPVIQAAARRTLRRRRAAGKAVQTLCVLCAAIALAPLVALVYYTAERGLSGLSFGFLIHAPVPEGVPGGGISTAITGTGEIVGLALVMAIPVGLMTALFLHERRGHLASFIRFGADLLTGVPSIVIGIFAYALLVRPLHHFSNLAAAFALAVLMLPIMIRADEEAMRTVAVDLWEAGVALGARRSRVARSVVLRGALPGLVTGNLLAISRGVGETAPLLFTVAAPTFAMTLLIYTEGTQPFPADQQTAWATALVLLLFVLVLSGAARLVGVAPDPSGPVSAVGRGQW